MDFDKDNCENFFDDAELNNALLERVRNDTAEQVKMCYSLLVIITIKLK